MLGNWQSFINPAEIHYENIKSTLDNVLDFEFISELIRKPELVFFLIY